MEAPQEILVPDEIFVKQMDEVNTDIVSIKQKIEEIEDKKKQQINTIEEGTKEDGSLSMKAKIAIQELHALVNSEDVMLALEAQIRKLQKNFNSVLKAMEDAKQMTSLGDKFWVQKEVDEMVTYKPGANIAHRLKAWGN